MPQVAYTLVADDEKARQQVERFMAEFEGGAKRATRAADGLGKGVNRFMRDLKQYAIGGSVFLGMAKAIGVAKDALRELHEERKRGAQLLEQGETGMAKLAQLAKGDPKKLRAMIDEAKATMRETGMGMEQAADLQFALESSGMQAQRAMFAGLAPVIGSPADAVLGAHGITKAMGAGETGTAQQLLNKVFAASEVSPVTFKEFMPQAALTAPMVKQAGGTDEELLAALALVAPAAGGNIEAAGTQIQGFAKALLKKGMTGTGLVDAARQIQGMGMTEQELVKFFGRQEGYKGYLNILGQAEGVEALSGRLGTVQAETGTPQDLLTGMLASYEAIPEFAGPRARKRQQRELELAQMEEYGTEQAARETAVLSERTRGTRARQDAWTKHKVRKAMGVANFFGADPEEIRLVARAAEALRPENTVLGGIGVIASQGMPRWLDVAGDIVKALIDATAATRDLARRITDPDRNRVEAAMN